MMLGRSLWFPFGASARQGCLCRWRGGGFCNACESWRGPGWLVGCPQLLPVLLCFTLLVLKCVKGGLSLLELFFAGEAQANGRLLGSFLRHANRRLRPCGVWLQFGKPEELAAKGVTSVGWRCKGPCAVGFLPRVSHAVEPSLCKFGLSFQRGMECFVLFVRRPGVHIPHGLLAGAMPEPCARRRRTRGTPCLGRVRQVEVSKNVWALETLCC